MRSSDSGVSSALSVMPQAPLVSVCIPSFNHGRFLAEAIESALRQTFRSFEIVIVDDGSADDSLDVARDYERRHRDVIRVFTHDDRRHCGIARTGNLAIARARGRYWAGLCSDDSWPADKLAREVQVAEGLPRVGIVYSYATPMDEQGRRISGRVLGADLTRTRRPVERLLQGNVISGITVLARREALVAAGLHDPDLLYQDWHLWLRVLARWEVAFVGAPLAHYRLHASNTMGLSSPTFDVAKHSRAVMLKLRMEALEVGGRLADARTRALIELQIAFYSFVLGENRLADEAVQSAFELDPRLTEDAEFLKNWLVRREINALHPRMTRQDRQSAIETLRDGRDGVETTAPERSSFALWFQDRAPVRQRRRLRREAIAIQYLAAALAGLHSGERLRASLDTCRALRVDPRLLRVLHEAIAERRVRPVESGPT